MTREHPARDSSAVAIASLPCMRISRRLALFCLLACMTTPAAAEAVPVWFGPPPSVAAVNSPVFARWAPLRGQLGYLQSIAYIDSRMRYVDPSAGFFVSPAGEICVRTRPSSSTSIYDDRYRTWCFYPRLVHQVEPMSNSVANLNGVRLWCAHDFPHCAYSVDEPGRTANSIFAEAIDHRQVRAVLGNLIFIMSGVVTAAAPTPLGQTAEIR
jgi:hypothetical protein